MEIECTKLMLKKILLLIYKKFISLKKYFFKFFSNILKKIISWSSPVVADQEYLFNKISFFILEYIIVPFQYILRTTFIILVIRLSIWFITGIDLFNGDPFQNSIDLKDSSKLNNDFENTKLESKESNEKKVLLWLFGGLIVIWVILYTSS